MPCKHYKEALIEAAASGAQPQVDLRIHLAACDDCRAAFEQEQSLFASIDGGLHVVANAEVPASLLPRVRACLDEAAASRQGLLTPWFALASAAVLVVAFFAARGVWRTNVIQKPVETVETTSRSPRVRPLHQNPESAGFSGVEKNSAPQRPLGTANSTRSHQTLVSGMSVPEVLVVRDQETLLAEYAEQWRAHKHPLLVAQEFDSTIMPPLQVSPIQIAELDVKLLVDEKSQ